MNKAVHKEQSLDETRVGVKLSNVILPEFNPTGGCSIFDEFSIFLSVVQIQIQLIRFFNKNYLNDFRLDHVKFRTSDFKN